jgi:hypothetical protein
VMPMTFNVNASSVAPRNKERAATWISDATSGDLGHIA